jgi:hypothetical protein
MASGWSGSPQATSSSGTPTHIASTKTYDVPVDTQLIVFLPIKVDGILVLDGDLVML